MIESDTEPGSYSRVIIISTINTAADGPHPVTVRLTDLANNSATASVDVVLDNTPPTVTAVRGTYRPRKRIPKADTK